METLGSPRLKVARERGATYRNQIKRRCKQFLKTMRISLSPTKQAKFEELDSRWICKSFSIKKHCYRTDFWKRVLQIMQTSEHTATCDSNSVRFASCNFKTNAHIVDQNDRRVDMHHIYRVWHTVWHLTQTARSSRCRTPRTTGAVFICGNALKPSETIGFHWRVAFLF